MNDHDELKRLVIETFFTNQKLLVYLRDRYLQAPVAPPGCDDKYPYRREGQNDLVRTLISITEEAIHGRISNEPRAANRSEEARMVAGKI